MMRQVIAVCGLLLAVADVRSQVDSSLDQRPDNSAWGSSWGARSNEGLHGSSWGARSNEGLHGSSWGARSNEGLHGSSWGTRSNEGLQGSSWGARSNEGLHGSSWGHSNQGQSGSSWGHPEGGRLDPGLSIEHVASPAMGLGSRSLAAEGVAAAPAVSKEFFRIYELSPAIRARADPGHRYFPQPGSNQMLSQFYEDRNPASPFARSMDEVHRNYQSANLQMYENSPLAGRRTVVGPPAEAPKPMTYFASKTASGHSAEPGSSWKQF